MADVATNRCVDFCELLLYILTYIHLYIYIYLYRCIYKNQFSISQHFLTYYLRYKSLIHSDKHDIAFVYSLFFYISIYSTIYLFKFHIIQWRLFSVVKINEHVDITSKLLFFYAHESIKKLSKYYCDLFSQIINKYYAINYSFSDKNKQVIFF